MPFANMIAELHGCIPKIPVDYAGTLINRAWKDTRRKNLWSFLMFDANWVSPPFIRAGTVTTTQGSPSVVLDATAAAAVIAGSLQPTILTQRQFRSAISTIYNIWAFDGVNTLTLDRNYQETGGAGKPYTIFQCYYPAPMKDFWSWVSIRDMVNVIDLFYTRYNRLAIDEIDPQRTFAATFPTDVAFYTNDLNPASATVGFPMFELWGCPQYNLVWQLLGLRKGTDLVNPSDALPNAVGEDCVMALARKYGYEWAEANKDNTGPRGSSPDYRFLIGEAGGDYLRLFREYRKDDREVVDNFFSIKRSSLYGKFYAAYNTLSSTAWPG